MKNFRKTTLRFPVLVSGCVCLGLLLIRLSPRFLHPEVWAEDGSLFLQGALNGGARELFEPYGGYLHIPTKLIARALSQLPLLWYPNAVLVVTAAAFAGAASLVARPQLRWLIPSDVARVLVAVALCFASGTPEVLGNLANLHAVVFLGATLLALSDFEAPLAVHQVTFLGLAGSCTGELVVLIPVFVVRACLRAHGRWRELVVAGMIAVWTVFNLIASSTSTAAGEAITATLAVERGFKSLLARIVLHPLLGDHATRWFFPRPVWLQVLIAGALVAVFVLGLRKVPRQPQRVLLTALAAACGVVVLTWIVRPWSLNEHTFGGVYELNVFEHRYWFTCAPMALVAWMAALSRLAPRGVLVLPVLSVLLALPRAPLKPYEPATNCWPDSAARLEAHRAAGTAVDVPIAPEDWAIRLAARKL